MNSSWVFKRALVQWAEVCGKMSKRGYGADYESREGDGKGEARILTLHE